MKMFIVVLVALIGCSKKEGAPASGSAATGSGSAAAAPAAPVEDVSCNVAAKEYTTKMAATPGNVLSDAKPDKGLIYFTSISMEDYCEGEDGAVVAWTPQERACVKAAAPTAEAVTACFTGAALSQVNAGLNEVVSSALANQKKNAEAAGSAAGSAEKPQ